MFNVIQKKYISIFIFIASLSLLSDDRLAAMCLTPLSISGSGAQCPNDAFISGTSCPGNTILITPGGATTTVSNQGTFSLTFPLPPFSPGTFFIDFTVISYPPNHPELAQTEAVSIAVLSVIPTVINSCTAESSSVALTLQGGPGPFFLSVDGAPAIPFTSPINNLTPGTHTFTVSRLLPFACTTVTATTAPGLSVNISSPTTTVCQNSPLQINATISGGTGNYTILWTGPNGQIPNGPTPSTIIIPNAQPSDSGTYTITVTDSSGCTGTQSIDFSVVSSFNVTLTGTTTNVCPNGTIMLTATAQINDSVKGPFTYEWFGPNGRPISATPVQNTISIPDVTSANQGNYSVIVTDSPTGCTSTAEQLITVQPQTLTDISIIPAQSTLCVGGETILTAIAPDNFTFKWTGPGINDQTTSSVTVTAATSGTTETFSVVATDPLTNCSGQATATVTVSPNNGFSINVTPTDACQGLDNGSISVAVVPGTGKPPYTLSIGKETIGQFTNFSTTVTDLPAGSKSVTVTDSSTPPLCVTQIVMINSVPLNVSLSGTTAPICTGTPGALLIANVTTGTGPFTFTWSNSSGVIGTSQAIPIPTITPFTDTYTVTVTDTNGCTGQASQVVVVFPC